MFKTLFFCFGVFYENDEDVEIVMNNIFNGVPVKMAACYEIRWYLSASIPNIICGSFECHDDSAYEPTEGPITELQFTWLGALQYIHVKNGNPHYFRVPRVSLITRQFVISTAKDAAEVPSGYALGNVVFPEYERDEKECGITIKELAAGASCDPAVLLMPIADVLLHPEYKHFGVKSSIALLKLLTPLASHYMVPVCLPFRNFMLRPYKEYVEKLNYVDFISEVPRDFLEEEKELVYLRMVPRERCIKHELVNESSLLPDRHICSTGCDLQSGAPSLVHEHTGHWNLFAISEGGSPCPDPLRARGPSTPSRHILMNPYVPWITTAISGQSIGSFSKDDPFGFGPVPRAYPLPKRALGWLGHWWLGGDRCYDRGDGGADIYRFYHELFDIYPDTRQPSYFTYYLEIHSPYQKYIVCVKVAMPYQYQNPMVWGINTIEAKLRIPLLAFTSYYRIVVTAWCNNGTEAVAEDDDYEERLDSSEYSEDSEVEQEYIYDMTETRGVYVNVTEPPEEIGSGKGKGKGMGNDTDSLTDEDSLTPPTVPWTEPDN